MKSQQFQKGCMNCLLMPLSNSFSYSCWHLFHTGLIIAYPWYGWRTLTWIGARENFRYFHFLGKDVKGLAKFCFRVCPVLRIEFGPQHADFGTVWSPQKACKFRHMQQTTKMGILCVLTVSLSYTQLSRTNSVLYSSRCSLNYIVPYIVWSTQYSGSLSSQS